MWSNSIKVHDFCSVWNGIRSTLSWGYFPLLLTLISSVPLPVLCFIILRDSSQAEFRQVGEKHHKTIRITVCGIIIKKIYNKITALTSIVVKNDHMFKSPGFYKRYYRQETLRHWPTDETQQMQQGLNEFTHDYDLKHHHIFIYFYTKYGLRRLN